MRKEFISTMAGLAMTVGTAGLDLLVEELVEGPKQTQTQTEKKERVVYSQDFSKNPNWETNSPEHFRWDPEEKAYFMHVTRNPTGDFEHASFQLPNELKGSFRLSYDVKPITMGYAADLHLGFFKNDMKKKHFHIMGGLANPDQGVGMYVDAINSNGNAYGEKYDEDIWELNKWHHAVLTYNHEEGFVQYELSRGPKPEMKFTTRAKKKIFFDGGFVRLGATTHGLTPYKDSYAEGYIRNIKLTQ